MRARARTTASVPARREIPATARLGSTSGAGVGLQFGLVVAQGTACAAVLTPNTKINVKNVYLARFFKFAPSLRRFFGKYPEYEKTRPLSSDGLILFRRPSLTQGKCHGFERPDPALHLGNQAWFRLFMLFELARLSKPGVPVMFLHNSRFLTRSTLPVRKELSCTSCLSGYLRFRARTTTSVPVRSEIPATARLGSTSGAAFGVGFGGGGGTWHQGSHHGQLLACAAVFAPNARTKAIMVYFRRFLMFFFPSRSCEQIPRLQNGKITPLDCLIGLRKSPSLLIDACFTNAVYL